MTEPFDPKDKVWEIRVQFGDVVSFIDESNPEKRRVGTVRDVRTGFTTAGTMAHYGVYDEEDRVTWIDNFHDPRKVDAALLAEYKARRRVVVLRKNIEWAERRKGYCCTPRCFGYESCGCPEPRGYVAPRLTLRERCVAATEAQEDSPDPTWVPWIGKWELIHEIARLVRELAAVR